MAYYIGLMSGTSMDGVDALVLDCDNLSIVAQHKHYYPKALEQDLKNLRDVENVHLDILASLNARIGEVFARATLGLLECQMLPEPIIAIGSHGQTVLHKPDHNPSYTLQLGCPHIIALRTRLPVVADFRSRDMRLGGQGAPLAPLFHRVLFAAEGQESFAVLNLGGIANLSLFSNTGQLRGFDTGPANVLIDMYCQRHFGCDFDADGYMAMQGKLLPNLLCALKTHPYLQKTPPKSADKLAFTYEWLSTLLCGDEKPEDVLHTLTHFTADTVIEALDKSCAKPARLICCGGGASNGFLMRLLKNGLPAMQVQSSAELGYPVDAIEAMMMAWLAYMHCEKQTLDYRLVTGANAVYIPGVYYPPG